MQEFISFPICWLYPSRSNPTLFRNPESLVTVTLHFLNFCYSTSSCITAGLTGMFVLQLGITAVPVRWLNLQEYQSKKLMEDHGINIQKFKVATTPDEAEKISKTFSKCICINCIRQLILCFVDTRLLHQKCACEFAQ